MNKPIAILIRDLQASIVQAVNESQLPPSIVEPVFEAIHQQIVKMVQAEINQAEEELRDAESN